MTDGRNLLIVALVAALAYLVGSIGTEPAVVAQGYPGGTADSNAGMVAVTGTVGSGISVLYVIDTKDRRLAVYASKGGKSIELVAARNIEWDFEIETLNDVSRRSPADLRRLFMRGAGKDASGVKIPEDKGTGSGQTPVPGGKEEGD